MQTFPIKELTRKNTSRVRIRPDYWLIGRTQVRQNWPIMPCAVELGGSGEIAEPRRERGARSREDPRRTHAVH